MFVEGESLMIRTLIASASLNLSAVRTEAMSILHYKNHNRNSFLIYYNNTNKRKKKVLLLFPCSHMGIGACCIFSIVPGVRTCAPTSS